MLLSDDILYVFILCLKKMNKLINEELNDLIFVFLISYRSIRAIGGHETSWTQDNGIFNKYSLGACCHTCLYVVILNQELITTSVSQNNDLIFWTFSLWYIVLLSFSVTCYRYFSQLNVTFLLYCLSHTVCCSMTENGFGGRMFSLTWETFALKNANPQSPLYWIQIIGINSTRM